MTEFLVAAAEPSGLVVVLDDLQWADPASARLLVHLARSAGRSRLASPLTRREQEIAALVSQGLSNRQIAATAFIGERTVETHVQHILGKLGFTARTQLAAWVVQEKMRTGHQY